MRKALLSTSPDGRGFEVPDDAAILRDFLAIEEKAREFHAHNRQVVVVQGLGFVGSAVAAAIASAHDGEGRPRYLVIGTDLADVSSYWKIACIMSGMAPVNSPDHEFGELIFKAVRENRNLYATSKPDAYGLADVIVVDIPLAVRDRNVENPVDVEIDLASFASGISVVGRHMREDALVLVETTVPIGATEKIIRPILLGERNKRGIDSPLYLAHAYERVMPGPNYIRSINKLWRTFAGIDEASAEKAKEFLSSFIDVEAYPLCQMTQTSSSELAKLLENSYRAANIAFIYEWTLLAERMGIDLYQVIDSIRVRKGTHDNIRYPGFGVGGYCLTKDGLLAQWSLRNLFNEDLRLNMTLEALGVNYRMPLHSLDLMMELLGGSVAGKAVVVCGVTYLAEVPDTRNSPTELLVDALVQVGAEAIVHDPYVSTWPERPRVHVETDLAKALKEADGIILAVRHKPYLDLTPKDIVDMARRPPAIVDAQDILDNPKAEALHDLGCCLAGVGKGHWRNAGLQCRK
jgi:nucleotide sugar dehydrogenase